MWYCRSDSSFNFFLFFFIFCFQFCYSILQCLGMDGFGTVWVFLMTFLLWKFQCQTLYCWPDCNVAWCLLLVNTRSVVVKQPHASFSGSTLRHSRPNKASLKCPSVNPSVRPSVCPSTKSFFDFNEIWRVGTGRWVMHDGIQYDPIHSQGQVHEPFKVGNPVFFKSYLRLLQWELAADHRFLN